MKKIILSVGILLLALAGNVLAQGFSTPRPTWHVGDTWSWMDKSRNLIFTQTVLGSKTIGEYDAYEVKCDDESIHYHYYTKDLEEIQGTDRSGNVTYMANPPFKNWNWPLEPNKKWSFSYSYSSGKSGTSNTYNRYFKIESKSLEKVRVPAGEFEAVKVVEDYSHQAWWYAPEIKNYVKRITPRKDGEVVLELVSYKIDGGGVPSVTPSVTASTPLPENVKIIPPPPDLPKNIAAFSGVWIGELDNGRSVTLVVEKIELPEVTAIYSWGPFKTTEMDGYTRRVGKIGPGKLELHFPESDITVTCLLSEDGNLQLTWKEGFQKRWGGKKLKATMQRK